MDLKKIRSEVQKLSAMVEGWHSPEDITTLERDLALEKLRMLYDQVCFVETSAATLTVREEPLEAIPVIINLDDVFSVEQPVVVEQPIVAEPAPAAEIPAEPVVETTSVEPIFEEMVVETVEAEEVVLEEAPVEEAPAESVRKSVIGSLFGVEDLDTGHRRKQRVIMSLYDPEPSAPVAKPAPVKEPVSEYVADEPFEMKPLAEESTALQPEELAEQAVTDFEEQTVAEGFSDEELDDDEGVFEEVTISAPPSGAVLGEVINHDVQTLSDTLAAPRDMASELRRREPVTDLRRVIGINDKFLMIHDLFGGESREYEQAIDALNDFEDLDDCMIFIAENYAWNPNSDGAKLLMELLERKFV